MIFRSPWPDIEPALDSVCDAVLGAARQFGNKPAIIEGDTGRTLSYQDLVERSEHVAAGLASAGLRPGQALALALPNSIEFVLTWYGTLRAGGWVVPINPLYTAAETEVQIRDSGARFAVTVPERAATLTSLVDHLYVAGGNWSELERGLAPPDVRIRPQDLAALPYSSGTTGKPKGVMLTHANIAANIRQQSASWPRSDDVLVNIFPLYHAAGLNGMLNTFLCAGATIVLMRRFDLANYLALSERYGATILGAPPPVILTLTKSPLWDDFRLDPLRRGLCGAAPLGAELHESFERRTGVSLGQVWGMTEATCGIASALNAPGQRKFGSCGHLLPSCEAKVVDVSSQQLLGSGEAGEIWLRGPNIMKGYWNQPDATSDTLAPDGWMRTGDIGYFDADGCVFLVDRVKELIKYNALQVAPAELEDVIQSHPAVSDAAVVGAPDPSAGEIPIAFIVRKEGAVLEAEELMQYVAARVAPHKKIRGVRFVQQIPKSPTGKILRRVLKEQVHAELAANA
ncbi:MAG TPA: AMP-binding protein [Bryobacteraceae bacterium]|nr:AMP-binding protein [Bryobacteraceae bacterium]